MNRQPINERFITRAQVVENKKDALPPKTLCRAQYEICTVGKKNRNNRIYEKAVWEGVLGNPEIKEKLANKSMFFHAEHPTTTQSSGEKIAGVVTGINIDESTGKVSATMDVLETPYGQIVDTLLQAGCGIGVSTRADGELEEAVDEAGNKYSRVVPESYRFVTVDFTADPSNFGSELPMDVRRNVAGAIKTGLDNEKIDRMYATVLLESLKCQEATTILESLSVDQHHPECKCKPTEKACKSCPHAVKEAVKCPQCQSEMVGYKDGVICPQCGDPNAEQMEQPQQSNDTSVPPASPDVYAQEGAVPPVGNESKIFKTHKACVKESTRLKKLNPNAKIVIERVVDGWKVTDESKVNEVEFTNLDSVLSSDKPMSEEDLVAAVKLSMSAEFDATELYKKIANATDNEMAKKVMQSIADEESIHAGEFRKLIATLQPGEEELEVKGEKEAGDVMDKPMESVEDFDKMKPGTKAWINGKVFTKMNPDDETILANTKPEDIVKESLLKIGDRVTYKGKEYTVKAVNEEDMVVTLNNGTTVDVDAIEDFLTETTTTTSDTSGQPADGKAAEEVMNKSAKRHTQTDESTDPKRREELKRQLADARRQSDADAIREIEQELDEDVQLEIEVDPKVEQFLQDNWTNFVDDEDKVNNLIKLFKITPAKARKYIENVAHGKATMNAVYTMAEAAWKTKAESLEEKVSQLNTVIDALNEQVIELKEKNEKGIKSSRLMLECRRTDADRYKQATDQLSEAKKNMHEMKEAGQSLVKEYEKKIKLLKEQHNKELIKFYIDARTKAIRLNVSEKALTILESCGTREEVDSEIRRLQNEIREAALQSSVPTEINVTKTVQVSPVMHDINNKVAKAFRSFGA